MKARPPIVRAFFDDEEEDADNFAGGGGWSTGFEDGAGRSPDVAVNHDAEAIAMHAANHPTTRHYTDSVYKVDPRKVCKRPVRWAHFSPDCKHHSKAKGGKPRDQKIRGLAWIAVTWAQRVQPRIISLENVEEFREWGPLHRDHTVDGCHGNHRLRRGVGAQRRKVIRGCLSGCRFNKPIIARRGETFRAFVRKLERLGYVVEHWLLRACDYGAPTTRRRLFMVARRDGQPIVWPAPTHGKGGELLGLRPYRTAAECIDWSIPCPSIFDRDQPLAAKTLARIARGVRKFVLGAARPFVLPVNHGGAGRRDHRVHDVDAPLPTITGGQRGGHALAVPYLVHRSNGERPGQAPRIYDPTAPLGTVVAQGQKHALCAAFLAKHYGGNESRSGGTAADAPVDAVTARDHHSLVASHLIKLAGTSEAHLDASAHSLEEPLPTITAGGWKMAQVAAFLVKYYGAEQGQHQGVDAPVTVTIDGAEYAVVDIGMRMLEPRELFRAQGFSDDYEIAPVIEKVTKRGKVKRAPLSKTAQIRMCGNSVSPPVAAAVVRANLGDDVRRAA